MSRKNGKNGNKNGKKTINLYWTLPTDENPEALLAAVAVGTALRVWARAAPRADPSERV